jgi:hypothetical protein
MATQKVFILGAGASVPFGFPTGPQLVESILQLRKESVPEIMEGLMCQKIFDAMGFDQALLNRFRSVIRHSQVESIDELLSQPKNEVFDSIGKFMLAAALVRCEKIESLLGKGEGTNRNWYTIVWRYLKSLGSIENILNESKISFITYNYDRSLECYLWNVLKHHYGIGSHLIKKFLSENIFHVHGQLGSYRGVGGGQKRQYKPTVNELDEIKAAMSGIKIIHEVNEYPKLKEIQRRLSEANQIYFIGCHYHQDNLSKLARNLPQRQKNLTIYGSTYGLSVMEMSSAARRLSLLFGIDIAQVNLSANAKNGCYDFLRENFEI